jgi:hypothetical protein
MFYKFGIFALGYVGVPDAANPAYPAAIPDMPG